MAFYVVIKGRKRGIFRSWEDCDMHVDCSFPIYKGFETLQEAAGFIISCLKQRAVEFKKQCPVRSDRVRDLQNLPTRFFKWPFHVDSEGFVQVYVDGSCFENGKNGAKAGLGVFFGNGHAMNVSKAVQSDSTQSNNSGELQAVKEALRVAKQCGIKKLKIHSDSQYVIKCFNYWVKSWQTKGWMTSASTPVKNKKVIEEICDIWNSENIQIEWNFVPAHRGIRGNEAADRLAKNGAKRAVRGTPY
ncbi:ribonuclease H-like isoform X2 [Daphnia pulex]|uniref:ribonuclease H-like isoform X2 n=1 Tax=Daphnia pulex TaxID=6669 RepID=UPI001EDDB644|nr:ribonuclease H-like isoform X2 [Daphnia pulex]